MNPPPQPPPHGEVPKGSGLPPGKYDIFVIPPHSSGSGFLYLPSLQPNVNSFAAGFASALILVAIGSMLAPALQAWWYSMKGSGGMGILMLMMAIGLGAWSLGRTQGDGGPGPGGGGSSTSNGGTHSNTQSNGYARGPAAGSGPGGGGAGPQSNGYSGGSAPGAGYAGGEIPKPSWQRTSATNGANAGAGTSTAKSAWEKAREETKKKEDERKAKEAERKRKEELEKKLKEAREKEAQERQAREKKQREGEANPKGSTYAYSATGEKTNPWPRGYPSSPAARSQPPSPTKRPPAPTAKTYLGTEDDEYSFRPYDKPTKPTNKASQSSLHSESSYAASHSTSRTTPPPSNRGPYSTKDPDKIVIKAVYAFNNDFNKTPTSQLISGVGSVTDGLILRITTEGLFIDDDVRGVPQREWDVKAWTMKLVEVWCPSFRQNLAANSATARATFSASPLKYSPMRRLWGLDKDKAATSEETDALLVNMLQLCKDNCRLHSSSSASSAYSASSYDSRSSVSDSAYGSSVGSSSPSRVERRTDKPGVSFQTGELKTVRLHLLRASIRDQEGKKYVFVIAEEESWKVSVGLQRLRRGTQVRALGVSGMSTGDARGTLENLGWA